MSIHLYLHQNNCPQVFAEKSKTMPEQELQQIAQFLGVSPEEALEQVILGSYGNGKIENPDITLEMVREAALADA